jgi:hypothetical protein
MARKNDDYKDYSNPNVVVGVTRVTVQTARQIKKQIARKVKGK